MTRRRSACPAAGIDALEMESKDPFADEPRKVGGDVPEREDEEAGGDGAGSGETPSEEIEDPAEGEAPSG